VALRVYDPEKKQWSISWLDGRSPGQVDVPAVGRFENGVGTFYPDDRLKGKPICAIHAEARHPPEHNR
jgi:hypothetical protein